MEKQNTDVAPCISCKPNEEWPYLVIPCYNEGEKERFISRID